MSAILCFILFIFLQMLPSAAQEDPRPNDESLLWGPYRPNLYLGIRPRISHSLLMGLMWSSLDDPSGIPNSTYYKAKIRDQSPLTLADL